MTDRQVQDPSTREMERINWKEFAEWVPSRIDTVLLPLGTLEAHGAIAHSLTWVFLAMTACAVAGIFVTMLMSHRKC